MLPKTTFSLPSRNGIGYVLLSILLPVPNIMENGDPDKSLLAPNTKLLPEISIMLVPTFSKSGLILIIEFGVSICENFEPPIIIVLLQS